MHFVIVGCGRVGALLAEELDDAGHSVAIVDVFSAAFDRLGSQFDGQTITGDGTSLTVLRKAHTGDAYGFAAVTGDDNANIISARIAQGRFDVVNVVAEISDEQNAELYERMSVPTVASAALAAAATLEWMLPPSAEVDWRHKMGNASLVTVRPLPEWAGIPFSQVQKIAECRVVFVTRLTRVILAHERMVVQEGDLLTVATLDDGMDVRDILTGLPPFETRWV